MEEKVTEQCIFRCAYEYAYIFKYKEIGLEVQQNVTNDHL